MIRHPRWNIKNEKRQINIEYVHLVTLKIILKEVMVVKVFIYSHNKNLVNEN